MITRTVPRRGPAAVALAVVALVTGTALAHAQAPVTVSGLPQQVIATFPEIGAPTFTTSPGTPSAGDTGGQGTGDAGESSTDGSGGSSDALNTMLGQPWGSTAVNNAEALGVNPSVLAATCVIESGCQNVGLRFRHGCPGAFQMIAATFNSSSMQRYSRILALPRMSCRDGGADGPCDRVHRRFRISVPRSASSSKQRHFKPDWVGCARLL